jgi:hypothetical protein
MLIDLHVHSAISSCSRLSVRDIIEKGRACGLDGVCITDHDTMDVLAQITEGFQSDGLLVLVGQEYATPQGDYLIFGDVEGLGPNMNGLELFAAVESVGGAVIAAHPFRGWRPSDVSVLERGRPVIEVENGRNTDPENAMAAALAGKLDLTSVAGSDAHSLSELGRYPTQFTVPVRSRADLVRALKAGHCAPAVMDAAEVI